MPIEQNLNALRRLMSPSLQDETYVYCCVPERQVPTCVRPIATFREAEGLTLIISYSQASSAELSIRFDCASDFFTKQHKFCLLSGMHPYKEI